MSASATLGSEILAGGILTQSVEEVVTPDSPNSLINPRQQTGFFTLGQRGYSRPEEFFPRPADAGDPTIPDITITSVAGAFIGKIRTDIQFSIVESIKFTLIDGLDCADFTMQLNKLPDFPIPRFSLMTFNISGRIGNWYTGLIEEVPEVGTQRKSFRFKGQGGSRSYARTLSGGLDIVVGTGRDVGAIFLEVCQTILIPETPINLNFAKINVDTGVILVNDLNFGKYKLPKIFDTLATMAGHIWGVDGDLDVYFLPAPKAEDTVQKTFFVGYDIQNFKPKENIKDVRNTIVVQRKQGRGSGGAGWVIGGIFSDESSIAKYRKKELNFQVPGFFEQEEIDIIGEALIAEKSEPKFSGFMDGFRIRSGADYLENGLYRFILDFEPFPVIFSDVDSAAEWTKTGAGDLTVVDENTIFVFGARGIKLNYTDAQNDEIELDSESFKGFIETIRVFIRANKTGQLATLGVGKTTAFENSVKLEFPIVNAFYNFDWDVSNLNITEVNKVAIRIDDPGPVASTDIYIDKIEFNIVGHKFYKIPLTKATYTFSPGKITARGEFGILPPKMENFLKSLFSTASELKFTQEID